MNQSYKITGADAVRLAIRDNLTLMCYANPLDDGGVITPELGTQIIKEDANLVYVSVTPDGWWHAQRLSEMEGYNVSEFFTAAGMYLGPDDDGVEPAWNDAVADYEVTDGFVTKVISARSAQEAAEAYAIVSSEVTVTPVDADGKRIGQPVQIAIEIA